MGCLIHFHLQYTIGNKLFQQHSESFSSLSQDKIICVIPPPMYWGGNFNLNYEGALMKEQLLVTSVFIYDYVNSGRHHEDLKASKIIVFCFHLIFRIMS
jgi:hypothetical protein